MATLDALLQQTAAMHHHLCPRQVLGVRMGLLAGELLGLPLPQQDKRLIAIVETDGCAVDGIAQATGCHIGRRTMYMRDFGKVAATFVDSETRLAVRIVPHPSSRRNAWAYAPEAGGRWQAQLLGYQRMPTAELLVAQPVALTISLDWLISRDGQRVACDDCGEEIINEREVRRAGRVLCRSCAGESYFRLAGDRAAISVPLLTGETAMSRQVASALGG